MVKRIDMIIVKLVGFLYMIKSFYKDEFCRELYTNLVISIVIFYVLEHILDFYQNNQWVIFHMAIHIYAAYIFILFLLV